ncbi:MAG: RNA-binding S4 domain-containing protein [Parvularcula sp.]|jgi:ribosome-associated heat shock protein Hsp15|nr:RNA-binding S4 domain-containing protein [Parvularcula sp.]
MKKVEDPASEAECQRLDKWLWAVRIFKTRADAAKAIAKQSPRLTRGGQTLRTDKPGFKLREGDVLTLMRGPRLFVIEVAGFPPRRVSAPEAQRCYIDRNPRDEEECEG